MFRTLFRLLRNIVFTILAPFWFAARWFGRPKSKWVRIALRPKVVEFQRPEPRWARFMPFGRPVRATSLHRLGKLVDRICDDAAIEGVLIIVPRFQSGWTACEGLRDRIGQLRAAGKEVVVALEQGGGNKELFVASAADKIYMAPRASLMTLGLSVQAQYMKPLLDRLGVKIEPFARKKFKTAAERLSRDSMSDPQREQLQAILDGQTSALISAVAERFGGDKEKARAVFERGAHRADELIESGLIDGAAYPDELGVLLGSDDNPIAFVEANSYLAFKEAKLYAPLRRQNYIAIVSVKGAISESGSPSGRRLQIVSALRKVRCDKRALGAVLYVNSPGGSADASDLIHRVVRLKDKKPVVASFGDVAASGGYYVAAPTDAIVSRALTLTGSIGVVSAHLTATKLLSDLGVRTEVIKTAPHADMLLPHRPITDAERTLLDGELDAFYEAFVSLVAQGRVWSGTDALKRRLVDKIGGPQEAINEVKSRLDLPTRALATLEPRLVFTQPFDEPPPAQAFLSAAFGGGNEAFDLLSIARQGHRALYHALDLPKIR